MNERDRMNQSNQALLRKLIKYDYRIAREIEPLLKVEDYQYKRFIALSNYYIGIDEVEINEYIDDFVNINQYLIAPNKDAKSLLDLYPYDFKKMFFDLDERLEGFDDYAKNILAEFEIITSKLKKSGGFFGDPLSPSDIEKFIELMHHLYNIKSIIYGYIAVGCIMNRSFYFFSPMQVTETLNANGIDTKNLPYLIKSMRYSKIYSDSLFLY
jgi:hypothetical protein